MLHADPEAHGPSLMLARSEVGSVSLCSCGVITLTLQYLSLRFDAAAFRELQGLLALAQHRLDGDAAASTPVLAPAENTNVH